MPLDADECHENAKRCLATALETNDLTLKASLTDNAQRWLRLAVDVQATKELLEKWSEKRRSQAG